MRKSYTKKLSGEEKQQIIELYQNGETGTSLAKKFNVDPTSIYSFLKRRNISTRIQIPLGNRLDPLAEDIKRDYLSGVLISSLAKRYGATENEITSLFRQLGVKRPSMGKLDGRGDEVIDEYKNGVSILQLSKKYNLAAKTITGLLKNHEINQRSRSEQSRKYNIDETYLDAIDSEQKAYYLGFMYADGYNGEKDLKHKVSIQLQSRDRHILESFKNLLQSEHTIRTDSRGIVCFDFNNKRLSERLAELGCYRAKSFTLEFPEWLPNNLMEHFIRGYYDGDGWVAFNDTSDKSLRHCQLGAIGSIPFIERMAQVISSKTNVKISFGKHQTSEGIIKLQVSGRDQVSTVLAWMYKNATIYLERKKLKAERILLPNIIRHKPNGSDCRLTTLNENQVFRIHEMLLSGKTNRKIKAATGVSLEIINDIRKGRTWHHLTGFNSRNNLAEGKLKGERHNMAILGEKEVLLIKELIEGGMANVEIAKQFNITRDTISKIKCGKIWTHVTGFNFTFQGKARKGEGNGLSKLNNSIVLEIKNLLEQGINGRTIAKKYSITPTCVSSIKNGHSWSHITGFAQLGKKIKQ